MAELIVHIARRSDLAEAGRAGTYAPDSLAREGFIHLSRPEDVHLPANALYSGEDDLVLLWVDPARLTTELRYEPPGPGAPIEFPHLYGPLDLGAIVARTPLAPWQPGAFELPPRPTA